MEYGVSAGPVMSAFSTSILSSSTRRKIDDDSLQGRDLESVEISEPTRSSLACFGPTMVVGAGQKRCEAVRASTI